MAGTFAALGACIFRDVDHRRYLRVHRNWCGQPGTVSDPVFYRRLIVHGVFDAKAHARRGARRRAISLPHEERKRQVKTTHSAAFA